MSFCRIVILVLVAVCCVEGLPLRGQNFDSWNGFGSNDEWTTDSNWLDGSAPTGAEFGNFAEDAFGLFRFPNPIVVPDGTVAGGIAVGGMSITLEGQDADSQMTVSGAPLVPNVIIGGFFGDSSLAVQNGRFSLKDVLVNVETPGSAQLLIGNGSNVMMDTTLIGSGLSSASSGRVTIDGGIAATDLLAVGFNASAILEVLDGHLSGPQSAGTPMTVGQSVGSNGLVVVDGSTSAFDANTMLLGPAGQATFNVTDGGSAVVNALIAAEQATSTASINVSGVGSTFAVSSGSPPADFNANGLVDGGDFLQWQRGESPNSNSADLQDWLSGYGADSGLATAILHAGSEVEVSDGGQMIIGNGLGVPGSLSVTNNGALLMDGVVTGSFSQSGGVVGPGSPFAAGVLTVNGDLTTTGGILDLEIGASTHDQIIVSGAANLNSSLDVSLIGGFLPSVGQEFTVLTAASLIDSGLSIVDAVSSQFELVLDSDSLKLRYLGNPSPLTAESNAVTVTVPEPTASLLTCLALAWTLASQSGFAASFRRGSVSGSEYRR